MIHTFVLGAESWNCMRPILAFSTLVGPPAVWTAFLANTKPSTSSVSSIVPPSFFTICFYIIRSWCQCINSLNLAFYHIGFRSCLDTFISFKSTFVAVLGSITRRTASTASGAIKLECCDTTWKEKLSQDRKRQKERENKNSQVFTVPWN